MEKRLAEIILFDDQNRVLLQHRTEDAPTYPNEYCIFGGKIEEGEDPEETVKRECYEELEYNLENPQLMLNITLDSKYGKRIKYIFVEKYNPDKKLVLHEGQAMKWIHKDELKDLAIIEHDKPVLEEFFKA